MKNQFKFILLLLVPLFLITNCKNKESNKKKETIVIGSILPLTGPAAVYGDYVKRGQEKALTIINDSLLKGSNVSVEIIFEDGKASPKESILAYKKLRNKNVKIFNTTVSSICLSIMPKAIEENVLLFADAAHPMITNPTSPYVYRHSNTSEQEADLIYNYIKDSIKTKNIGLLYVNDDYGNVFNEYLEKKIKKSGDLNLNFSESFNNAQTDFKVISQKLKSLDNITLITIGYGQSLGLLIKEIRISKNNSPIIAGIGYAITGSKTSVGEFGKGIRFVNFAFENDSDDRIKGFETLGYGTTLLIGRAIKEGHTSPQEISKYINSLDEFDTGYEKITLSKNHDMTPNLKIEIEN